MRIKKVTKYEVNGKTFDCFVDSQNYVASQDMLERLGAFVKANSKNMWVHDTSADPYIELIDLPEYLYDLREGLLAILGADGGSDGGTGGSLE